MMNPARRKTDQPLVLPQLPNEVFLEIAYLLCTSDLRQLGRVNRRLQDFVADYLSRYRYNVGIHALPNELVLEIAQHLGHQKDCSHLARASQRFYPVVMRYIVRHDVVSSGSSLLNFAAKRNLVGMARRIIRLGGDVNTRIEFSTRLVGKQLTPLATAARHGHQRIVKMLLEFGASHFVDGKRLPLALAILSRHENVAMILSQELDSSEASFTSSTRQTLLQMACAAQLVSLVRYYLEHIPCSSHDCDVALLRIIQKDARKIGIIKRQLYEDVFQIVLMLLRHGANPDICIRTEDSFIVTARGMASGHPDPRIRNVFPKSKDIERSKASTPRIRRPWMPTENEFPELQKSAAEVYDLEESRYATLWDFVEAPTEDAASGMEEQGMFLSSAAKLAFFMEIEPQRVRKRLEPETPPPLSSYPELSGVQGIPQHAAENFWANLPLRTFSESPPPRSNVRSTTSRSSEYRENSEAEEAFPALAHPGARQDDTRKDVWANFRSKDSPSVNSDERTSHDDDGVTFSVRKKSKKKWEPLSL